MTRMKLAELTSGVGALVLGIGLGALFAAWVGPAAGFVTLGGLRDSRPDDHRGR